MYLVCLLLLWSLLWTCSSQAGGLRGHICSEGIAASALSTTFWCSLCSKVSSKKDRVLHLKSYRSKWNIWISLQYFSLHLFFAPLYVDDPGVRFLLNLRWYFAQQLFLYWHFEWYQGLQTVGLVSIGQWQHCWLTRSLKQRHRCHPFHLTSGNREHVLQRPCWHLMSCFWRLYLRLLNSSLSKRWHFMGLRSQGREGWDLSLLAISVLCQCCLHDWCWKLPLHRLTLRS